MEQKELSYIMNIIEKYFPKNLEYSSNEYQNSKQFLLYKMIRNQIRQDKEFIKSIENKLKEIFKEYAFKEYIDWDDFKCMEFKINMHKNVPLLDDDIELIKFLGGKQRELYVSISILAKYYYIYFGETYYDESSVVSEDFYSGWSFSDDLKPVSKEEEDLLLKLDILMKSMGYKKLSNELANFFLDDIETEFNQFGSVNIFDCLFTDFTIFFA